MKRKIIFVVVFLVLFFIGNNQSFAQDNLSSVTPANSLTETSLNEMLNKFPGGDAGNSINDENSSVGNANCFDYYKFQSIQVNSELENNFLKSGDQARFNVEIINENTYPIVDGVLFVRISQKNTDFVKDGNFIVDEFFALDNLELDSNQIIKKSFSWKVPVLVKEGDYQMDFFFSQGKKFNLGGLTFTNEVIISSLDFKIDSQTNSYISFKRDATLVNGEKYNQIGNWPSFKSNEAVAITHRLENTFNQDQVVDVKQELYFWDSLDEKNKIETKEEIVTIPANSSKEILYNLSAIKEPVYYLKTTASIDGQQSIINVRFLGEISRARLNSVILTDFPAKKGDGAVFAACFHNMSEGSFEGRVEVILFDKDDNRIDSWAFSGDIPAQISANKKTIEFLKDYDYIKLEAKLFDENNQIIDSYSTIYDCANSELDSCSTSSLTTTSDGFFARIGLREWIYIVFIIILIILTGYVLIRKIKGKNDITSFLILLSLIIGSIFIIQSYGIGEEASGQATPAGEIETKSANTSSNYYMYYDHGTTGWRNYTSGGVSTTFTISPNISITQLESGTAFNFTPTFSEPYFYANGGSWDTPYAKWTDASGDDGNIESDPSYMTRNYMYGNNAQYIQHISGGSQGAYVAWVCQKPTISYSTSNSGIVSCSGANCQTGSSGQATVTANIAATPCRIYVLASVDQMYGSTLKAFPSYRGSAPNCTNDMGPGCCYDNWNGQHPMYFWASDENTWGCCTADKQKTGMVYSYNLTYPGCFTRDADRGLHSNTSLQPTATIARGTYKINLPAKTLSWDVTVGPINHPPVAEIISPSGSISVDKGDSIDFAGTGTDLDGDSVVAYEWYDGACGVGTPLSTQASFSTSSLDGGDHVIYFRVQDEPGLWSVCDSVNVTVYPACDPATAPAGTIFCPGDNSNIEGGLDITATLVSSASDCTDSKKCEYYHLPIDGDPGSSHNEIFCQKPSENLCDEGTPTIVEIGDNGKSWIWICEGVYGGENVEGKAVRSCAYKEVSPN